MALVEKSVLVGYSAQQMFDLVDRIENYPQFLPWCGGTNVLKREESLVVATINIDYLQLKQSFTTENTKSRPGEMRIRLQEGPFSELEGDWLFVPLGEDACKVIFRLDYTFSSRALEAVLAPVSVSIPSASW